VAIVLGLPTTSVVSPPSTRPVTLALVLEKVHGDDRVAILGWLSVVGVGVLAAVIESDLMRVVTPLGL